MTAIWYSGSIRTNFGQEI